MLYVNEIHRPHSDFSSAFMAAFVCTHQPLTSHIIYAILFLVPFSHAAAVVTDKEILPPADDLKLFEEIYNRMIHGLATISDKQSMFCD